MAEKFLALCDIDRTIYDGFIILSFPQFQIKEGTISEATLKEMAGRHKEYNAGRLDYETFAEKILIDWAHGLKGAYYDQVLDQTGRFLEGEGNKLLPHTFGLVSLLKDTHDLYFVTGEPQFVAEAVIKKLGGMGHLSSVFQVEDGVFTGTVSSSLARREDKLRSIAALSQPYPRCRSFGFGDSEADIEMLNMVDLPVCINPNEGLNKYALERGWPILQPQEVVSYVEGHVK